MPTTTVGYRVSTPTAVAALIGMLMILTVLAALIPTTADAQPDSPIRISDDYCPLSNLA